MSKYIKPETELKRTSDWVSHFMIREGYHLDYTLESFSEIDRLFSDNINLILQSENINYIFAISAYIGEVFLKEFKGKWDIENKIDSEDESIGIVFKKYSTIYPANITVDLIQKKYTLKNYLKENFDKTI